MSFRKLILLAAIIPLAANAALTIENDMKLCDEADTTITTSDMDLIITGGVTVEATLISQTGTGSLLIMGNSTVKGCNKILAIIEDGDGDLIINQNSTVQEVNLISEEDNGNLTISGNSTVQGEPVSVFEFDDGHTCSWLLIEPTQAGVRPCPGFVCKWRLMPCCVEIASAVGRLYTFRRSPHFDENRI